MFNNVNYRRATLEDLLSIVDLLTEDDLGKTREQLTSQNLEQSYIEAFRKIDDDPNQYLMVVEIENHIVETCHLSIMHL